MHCTRDQCNAFLSWSKKQTKYDIWKKNLIKREITRSRITTRNLYGFHNKSRFMIWNNLYWRISPILCDVLLHCLYLLKKQKQSSDSKKYYRTYTNCISSRYWQESGCISRLLMAIMAKQTSNWALWQWDATAPWRNTLMIAFKQCLLNGFNDGGRPDSAQQN